MDNDWIVHSYKQEERGWGKGEELGIIILARCGFHTIKEHENRVNIQEIIYPYWHKTMKNKKNSFKFILYI